jgi:hypothetical protein
MYGKVMFVFVGTGRRMYYPAQPPLMSIIAFMSSKLSMKCLTLIADSLATTA